MQKGPCHFVQITLIAQCIASYDLHAPFTWLMRHQPNSKTDTPQIDTQAARQLF